MPEPSAAESLIFVFFITFLAILIAGVVLLRSAARFTRSLNAEVAYVK